MVEENGLETESGTGSLPSFHVSPMVTWDGLSVDGSGHKRLLTVRQYIKDDVTTVIAPTGLWFLVLKLYSFLFPFVLFFS